MVQRLDCTTAYWNNFYGEQVAPELPSQFALFVANEVNSGVLKRPDVILDVGCGNGRDSLFLSRLGFNVIGLDQSKSAIEVCNQRKVQQEAALLGSVQFIAGKADEGAVRAAIGQFAGSLLVYSRFFFHAIDEQAEARVLDQVAGLIAERTGALAVEYRTLADAEQAKFTSAHYRRFIDPEEFAARVAAAGLNITWRAEGRGMAKFHQDDAHVARLVAQS